MRPLCEYCKQKPAAVNYKKGNKVFYRKSCERCLHNGKGHGIPSWYKAGYRMKTACEKCGFKGKQEQFNVYHIDGRLNNTHIGKNGQMVEALRLIGSAMTIWDSMKYK